MDMKSSEAYDFRVQRAASTMRYSVTESIRNAIAVGRYEAGARMPERDLCEMTGVSRTVVREALRQLESEGLVHVIPHKGPTVATINREQAKGIYEVREVLESLAARLFAENATVTHMKALEDAYAQVQDTYDGGDVLDRLAAKNHFYDCLIIGAGNEALGQTLHLINARAMILRGRSLQMPSRTKQSLAELKAIITALKKRDADEAYRLAQFHVRQAAEAALQSFSD
jgi:DNA-binding GntR family transcriptional regulator